MRLVISLTVADPQRQSVLLVTLMNGPVLTLQVRILSLQPVLLSCVLRPAEEGAAYVRFNVTATQWSYFIVTLTPCSSL